jgi:RNA polymerase sigma-70 factor (ECF subfamily)
MAAVAARDSRAQRALVERVQNRVRRVVRLLGTSFPDADDAAQTSILEILQSAEGFRSPLSLMRWVDRITVRTTLRLHGRELRRRKHLARWLAPGVLPWGNAAATAPGERIGIDALLNRLSDDRRTAVVLRHALDYTVEEIAELTASPVGTVKDRLVTGRKVLRRTIEREAQHADRRRKASSAPGTTDANAVLAFGL